MKNLKNYIEEKSILEASDVEFSKEDAQAFFDSIDFDKLFDYISDTLGEKVKTPKIDMGKTNYANQYRVKFETENLASKAGIMAGTFKELTLAPFGNGLQISKETGEPMLWINIHWSFEYVSGGSNGTDFMSVHYTDKDGWTVRKGYNEVKI